MNHDQPGSQGDGWNQKFNGEIMRRSPEPWKPPAWLEPAFIYMAFTVAAVAAVALFLWVLVTFIAPFFQYSRETRNILLKYGQVLRVEYPNTVVSSETPNFITLVISGKSIVAIPSTFIVEIPPGLTVVEPAEQAKAKTLILSAPNPGSAVEPTQIQIGVVNSRSVGGIFPTVSQPVIITSSVMPGAETIRIGIETIPWVALRSIVNNTINERSTLILLVTGFLSGAGTLVLQYMKTHRDRLREDQQRKEKNFRDDLDKDFLETLNHFVYLAQRPHTEESDFPIYKQLVESCGWEHKLQQLASGKLQAGHVFVAQRAANVLSKLCQVFDHDNDTREIDKFGHSKCLARVCDLSGMDDIKSHILTSDDAKSLLTVCKRWQELKPIVTNLIHDFSHSAPNLSVIYETLAIEQKGQLLRDANIQKVIDAHLSKLKDDPESDPGILAAADNINDLLVLDIQWRDIRSRKERILSDKAQRWLAGHFFESVDANFSLGSEYAELDSQLREPDIEHPVFKEINPPFPIIVFGNEGMGKTVSALWLAEQHRKLTTTGVFPVYAPFESGVDLTHWIVEKIARALIDFVADNPRKFIAASDSHKIAMGRLMLWHTQNLEALRLNLYNFPFNNAPSDIEQVFDHIKRFAPKKFSTKPSKDELLNFLYLARPDIFDQIYFLWDIRSSSPHEEVLSKVKEMAGLAIQLARQNVFVKIFAPLTLKQQLMDDLGGIRATNNDLTWSEAQLRELVEKKMKEKFSTLWDKSVEDPVGMIVGAAEYSPRRLMRLLLRLMDYVDEHVQEGEKLKKSDFDQASAA